MNVDSVIGEESPEVIVLKAPLFEVVAVYFFIIASPLWTMFFWSIWLLRATGSTLEVLNWRIAGPPLVAIESVVSPFVVILVLRIAIREAWLRCTFTMDDDGITKTFPSGVEQHGKWKDVVDTQIWRGRLVFADGEIITIRFSGTLFHGFGDLVRLSGPTSQVAKDLEEWKKRPGHRLVEEYFGRPEKS